MGLKIVFRYLCAVVSLLSSSMFRSDAQTSSTEYRIGLWGGASHQYVRRTPGAASPRAGVYPVHEAYSINAGMLTERGWYLGIDAGLQEFDWAESYEYSRLWRAAALGGYRLWSAGHLNVLGKIGMGGGYYLAPNYVDDAAYNAEWKLRDSLSGSVGFALRRDESSRAQEVHFLMSAAIEISYHFRRHHTICITGGHQQGYRPFIDERYTVLSPGTPRTPGESFRLRINGTALPFSIGYSYRFRSHEPNSTKYRDIPPGGGFRKRR